MVKIPLQLVDCGILPLSSHDENKASYLFEIPFTSNLDYEGLTPKTNSPFQVPISEYHSTEG